MFQKLVWVIRLVWAKVMCIAHLVLSAPPALFPVRDNGYRRRSQVSWIHPCAFAASKTKATAIDGANVASYSWPS